MDIDSPLCQYFCQLLPAVVFVSGMKHIGYKYRHLAFFGGHERELCVHAQDRDEMLSARSVLEEEEAVA